MFVREQVCQDPLPTFAAPKGGALQKFTRASARYCTGTPMARVLNKFMENNFEKPGAQFKAARASRGRDGNLRVRALASSVCDQGVSTNRGLACLVLSCAGVTEQQECSEAPPLAMQYVEASRPMVELCFRHDGAGGFRGRGPDLGCQTAWGHR